MNCPYAELLFCHLTPQGLKSRKSGDGIEVVGFDEEVDICLRNTMKYMNDPWQDRLGEIRLNVDFCPRRLQPDPIFVTDASA